MYNTVPSKTNGTSLVPLYPQIILVNRTADHDPIKTRLNTLLVRSS